MKKLQRMIALFMSAVMLLTTLAGCGTENVEEGDYISKGIFFSMFIEVSGIYPLTYTEEDLERDESYAVAAQTMVDWDILSDKQVEKPDSAVTREIVAQSCMNGMTFRTSHEVEIKDIKKCEDEQAIMDAVGMGLFELENGYFDAKGKMTLNECLDVLEKWEEIELTSHFEEGTLDVEYNDNVTILNEDQVLGFEWKDEEYPVDADVEPLHFKEDGALQAHWLVNLEETDAGAVQTAASQSLQYGSMRIRKSDYTNNREKYQIGQIVLCQENFATNRPLPSNSYTGANFSLLFPASIKIEEVVEKGDEVELHGWKGTPMDLIKDVEEGKGINARCCMRPATDEGMRVIPEAGLEARGFKISATKDKIEVSFNHTFQLEDDLFGGTQQYRNQSFAPSVNLTASISDFKVDTFNVGKLLLEKKAEEHFSLSYKTTISGTLDSGGLRYSPANNGNGGLKYSPEKGFSGNLLANVKNARLTGAQAGGSEEIKLAQVVIPLGSGFTITGKVYLYIEFDGSVSFGVATDYKVGTSIKKLSRWNYQAEPIREVKQTKECKMNVNVDMGLHLVPTVDFFGTELADADVGMELRVDAKAKIVAEDGKTIDLYATEEDLKECDGSLQSCVNISLLATIKAEAFTGGSAVAKVLKLIGSEGLSWKRTVWGISLHWEDGNYVDACTRTAGGNDAVKVEKDDGICVDTYKVVLAPNEMTKVSITSLPMSDKDIYGKGGLTAVKEVERAALRMLCPILSEKLLSGITAKSTNQKVATVQFNERDKVMYITGVGVGSAQIKITVRDGNRELYTQEVSVTINPSATPTVYAGRNDTIAWIPFYMWDAMLNDSFIETL